jgi:very-short-patch-repair endonuclease
MRLESLVGVPFYAENWFGLRNRIKSREMDFVLFHKDEFEPILVIELDDSSHQREDRIERDKNIDRILHEAGLPILHVPAAYSYDPLDLLRKIKEKIEQDN